MRNVGWMRKALAEETWRLIRPDYNCIKRPSPALPMDIELGMGVGGGALRHHPLAAVRADQGNTLDCSRVQCHSPSCVSHCLLSRPSQQLGSLHLSDCI